MLCGTSSDINKYFKLLKRFSKVSCLVTGCFGHDKNILSVPLPIKIEIAVSAIVRTIKQLNRSQKNEILRSSFSYRAQFSFSGRRVATQLNLPAQTSLTWNITSLNC